MIERAGQAAHLISCYRVFLIKCPRGPSLLDGRGSLWLPRKYHDRSPNLISYQYMITKALWPSTLIRA